MEASLVFLLFSPLLGLLPSFSPPAKRKTLSGEDPRTIFLVRLNFLQLWLSHHRLNRVDPPLAASLPAKEHLQQKGCSGACAAVTLQQQGVPRVLTKHLFPGTVYTPSWVNQAQPAEGKCCWWDGVPAGSCASTAMPGRAQTLPPFHSSVGSSPETCLHLPAVKAALAILSACPALGHFAGRAGHPSTARARPAPCTARNLTRSHWHREFYSLHLAAVAVLFNFAKPGLFSKPLFTHIYMLES